MIREKWSEEMREKNPHLDNPNQGPGGIKWEYYQAIGVLEWNGTFH